MRGLLVKLKTAIYRNDVDLLQNVYKRSQDFFILQGIFVTMFSIFTGGVYLSGYAVYLKSSDVLAGYIAVLPSLCGLLMFLSSIVVERFQSKKKAVITVTVISRSIICSVALIPLFFPPNLQGKVLFIMLFGAFTLQGLSSVVINNWFISVVPYNIRGRYFSLRQSFALAVGMVVPLITGILIDSVPNKYAGFCILFILGMISMIFEVYAYMQIEEPKTEQILSKESKLSDMLVIPLKNREFMRYIAYMFTFYLVVNISSSFTSVFLIRYLKLPYTFINLMLVLFSFLQIICYRLWGRICDTKGNRFVLITSIWFFIGELLCWSLMSRQIVYGIMPVAYFFSAIANSGFGVGAFNFRFDIVPEKGRMLYDGFHSTAIGLAFLVGPLIGSTIKQYAASVPLLNSHIQFGEFRILYLLSCLGILLLQVVQVMSSKAKRPH